MPGKQTANCHDPPNTGGEFFREADFSLVRRSRLSAVSGRIESSTRLQRRTHLHSDARLFSRLDARLSLRRAHARAPRNRQTENERAVRPAATSRLTPKLLDHRLTDRPVGNSSVLTVAQAARNVRLCIVDQTVCRRAE